MERTEKTCTAMEAKLADLLLAPEAAPAKTAAHVAGCEPCAKELDELRATMALMDAWEAPEPSPFFMTRLNARLDEERRAEPANWLERLRARVAYGPQLHARPMAAMALTAVLLLGGGTYLGITNWISRRRRLRRPRWCTICRYWTTTINCWTSLRRSRAATATMAL